MVFNPKQVKTDGSVRHSDHYRCGTYHKLGKTACSPHSVPETLLKEIVIDKIRELAEIANTNYEQIDNAIKDMKAQKYNYEKTIENLKIQLIDIEKSIDILNHILEKKEVRRSDLELLVEKIAIYQDGTNKTVEVSWNEPFSFHESVNKIVSPQGSTLPLS